MTYKRLQILNVGFDFITYESAFAKMCEWRGEMKREIVTITNPHSVLLCQRDSEMNTATKNAGLVLPDGVGIIWAANILGYKHCGRVTGPELMLKLCDWGKEHNFRHFFYGGKPGVPEKLAENLSKQFPGLQIAGMYAPPFRSLTAEENEKIISMINESRADIVWVGMGAPKQEKWMYAHFGEINATAIIGVGAAFDFHSDNVKWAPRWIRKSGLEWAYRLVLEPKRMWRRNLDSPVFLAKVIMQKLHMLCRHGGLR